MSKKKKTYCLWCWKGTKRYRLTLLRHVICHRCIKAKGLDYNDKKYWLKNEPK